MDNDNDSVNDNVPGVIEKPSAQIQKGIGQTGPETLNLWQFLSLWSIYDIKIIDIVLTFAVLEIINRLWFRYSTIYVIILTLLIVIIYNIAFNPNFQMNGYVFVIVIVCIVLLAMRFV